MIFGTAVAIFGNQLAGTIESYFLHGEEFLTVRL
jgi:hypothetical protein